MVSDETLKSMLIKNIKSELGTVDFYLNNLSKLNYADNKRKINLLIMESVKHIEMTSQAFVEQNFNEKSVKIDPKAVEQAMKEETGLKEIYKYELNKIENQKIQKMLKELIAWEEKHEKIVTSLK
jgi:rubrerythrin